MGKYIRKAKLSDSVAVMEVPESMGVRTRAKTLALRRLQSNVSDSSCYLQLRSGRLVKASTLNSQGNKISAPPEGNWRQESERKFGPTRSSSRLRVSNSVNSGSGEESGSIIRIKNEEGCFESRETGHECDLGVETSFGENNLDFEPGERSTRESTPCSLIRNVDDATPGSSTRQTTVNAANRRSRSAVLGHVPSATEIEEFFTRTEQQQQSRFIEKYNFDIVNDVPLTGRYEWVRVNH